MRQPISGYRKKTEGDFAKCFVLFELQLFSAINLFFE